MGGKRTLDSSFIHSLPLFQSRRVLSPRDGRTLVLETLYEHCGELRDTVVCCRLRRSWARAGVRTEEFQARVRGKIRRLVNWQSGGRAASSGVRGGANPQWEGYNGTYCRSSATKNIISATTCHNGDDLRYQLIPSKRRGRLGHMVLVLAANIPAAYADRETAPPSSRFSITFLLRNLRGSPPGLEKVLNLVRSSVSSWRTKQPEEALIIAQREGENDQEGGLMAKAI